MKITEQDRIELAFIGRLIRKMIGWSLIICSLIFGYMLDQFYFPESERLIAGDFIVFLIGMFILMKGKKL